jgi:alpha-L-fucosidase
MSKLPQIRVVFLAFALAATAWAAEPPTYPVAPGPFKPSMESLAGYQCPEWFRDAKFGIWAHWGPQAVPMDGDWYARGMYEEGNKHYKYHVEHYGHPSQFGYKDIIPLWKAERWDPDRLMALYKKAGAKYFVSMGTHHDNFFLWNSKLHRWNAVNMGPRRDVVGQWQRAARKYGLRFGVSEHLGASFTWFQSAHRADKKGPLAGVPYDGADAKYWDLYHFPADPDDKGWYSTNPRWHRQWYQEIQELVDNYHPDLLYTDGPVPFNNEAGLSMIAHLYNASAARNGGRAEVVYNCKQKSEGRWVEDLERGIMPRIDPHPWQTDTSIGDWFYNRNWKFRPVSWVIHMLVDNVSKNGNLLLNVVQRPDGSLDPEVEQMLAELADWNAVHGEAIFGTRPWLVYGEGTVKTKGGHFKEDFKYTAQDIRFTTKGGALYAIALGWPSDGRLVVKSLATGAGTIQGVSLLGAADKLQWKQTAEGLCVTLPAQRVSPYTAALRITGRELKPVPVPVVFEPLRADAQGNLRLDADSADLHGTRIKQEANGAQTNIGFWDKADEWASWKVYFAERGAYRVTMRCATPHAGSEFVVEIAGQQRVARCPTTAGFADYQHVDLGRVQIPHAGQQVVTVRPRDAKTWKAVNVNWVMLRRVEEPTLTPPPRAVSWTGQGVELADGLSIVAPQAAQVARLLARELTRLHGVKATVSAGAASGLAIKLALAGTPDGDAALAKLAGRKQWPPPRNADQGYLLETGRQGATIFAQTPRGLIYGCQTLLQLVVPAPKPDVKRLLAARIVDYPQLPFRGVHICIFPNTELAAVRQAILVAARFKYNAVVIEPWAALKSEKQPHTAYANAYAPEQIRPLVELGQALGMEMIPMLNSWGHASGMRSRSGEHVVLDRYPEFKDLYEADGWSFRLSNPAVYQQLFDRYDELLSLFEPAKYFHVGMDEAWGHLGREESRKIAGADPVGLIVGHLGKMHDYFARRHVQVIMWHDMFLERNHPQLGRQSPANSVPPFNTHLALPQLPKDVIIAAWNYDARVEWPVAKYFHDKGYPVVVCPWKSKPNTVMLLDTAKRHDMLGLLETTWDSLDVCLPSMAEAAVLAWTPKDYRLDVPFDHWLSAIRALPIGNLPKLEETLR